MVKLAVRLGEWAQLLKIVNGFLRDRAVRAEKNHECGDCWREQGGSTLRVSSPSMNGDETDRVKAVARTIGVSLELLSETERKRFGQLGVFPEDAEIPVGVAARMWAATGGLEDFETEDLLNRLFVSRFCSISIWASASFICTTRPVTSSGIASGRKVL